jgi:hypothetical protein
MAWKAVCLLPALLPALLVASRADADAPPSAAAPGAVTFHVAPGGSDRGDGSAARPFRTLERAQDAVRHVARDVDVTVLLADGVYRPDAPLRFGTADGGHDGRSVTWSAAPGAQPLLSGGMAVEGWQRDTANDGVWVASVPKGLESRQLWVADRLAQRARIEVPLAAFTFAEDALVIADPAYRYLARLPGQHRIEVEGTGYFTDRYAVVDRIEGDRLVMQQPGWANNLIGFDTIARSIAAKKARLFLINARAFLKEAGQWYLDPAAGKLYYKPRPGEDMARVSVVLPRLEALLSIAGSYDAPVRDLRFTGLRFSHTSWLGPSRPTGYASQQSGAYLAERVPDYPADPIERCRWGCWAFERMRNRWNQVPAAVQVAAAARVTFDHNVFAHLGGVALGIGNNPDANISGIGLGTAGVAVSRNRFSDLSGGAIMAGGVRNDAHHPPRAEMGNRALSIADNVIENFAQDYKEQAGILVTYAAGTSVTHNDVSGAPYDGIDIGWGWGTNDPGGNPTYRSRQRGYYDVPGNPVYDSPTILRDTFVAYNRVHKVKQWFQDGGAIYHLSADPGAVIAENHVFDVPGAVGLYLDEGSRYVTVRDNVVDQAGVWLFANTMDSFFPMRVTIDNIATGNWHRGGRLNGMWTPHMNNLVADDHPITAPAWPATAQAIIAKAGVSKEESRQ